MPNEEDIHAYDMRRAELESHYAGKFVVFHGGRLIGVFDDFNSAGEAALTRFGDSPCLIRKVEPEARYASISVVRI